MEVDPFVTEALRKAAIIWVQVPPGRAVAAWTVWHDGAAYVVSGEGEQPAPGLAEATACRVSVRSAENGARILTWDAAVSRVEPGSELWAQVAPLLLAKRLNLPDPVGAEQRWAESATISRLAPTGPADTDLPDGSLAEPPAPSSARTPTTVPFTLHRTRR